MKNARLPDGWDSAWQAAKANRATVPAQVASIGTSISWGKNAPDFLTQGFVGRLKTALGATAEFIPVNYAAAAGASGTTPWVHSSITSYTDVLGLVYAWAITAGTASTLTTPYACTSIELVHYDYAASTWTYTVDGGSPVTVTNTGSGALKKTALTGLANTAHTVVLGAVSANNGLFLCGASLYTGGTGIWLARAGYSGANATDYLATSPVPADRPILWQGKTSATSLDGLGFPTQPHLAIIELGINDCTNGSTEDNYKAALRRLVQAIRHGQRDASILLVIPCYPDGVNSDANIGGTPTVWYKYINWAMEMAEAYTCGVYNFHARWGETPVADGLLLATDIHPTGRGHEDMARVLGSLI